MSNRIRNRRGRPYARGNFRDRSASDHQRYGRSRSRNNLQQENIIERILSRLNALENRSVSVTRLVSSGATNRRQPHRSASSSSPVASSRTAASAYRRRSRVRFAPSRDRDRPGRRRPTLSTSSNASTTSNFVRSSNRDFHPLIQQSFRLAQLTHHLQNWSSCPKSIDANIDELIADINPPMSTRGSSRSAPSPALAVPSVSPPPLGTRYRDRLCLIAPSSSSSSASTTSVSPSLLSPPRPVASTSSAPFSVADQAPPDDVTAGPPTSTKQPPSSIGASKDVNSPVRGTVKIHFPPQRRRWHLSTNLGAQALVVADSNGASWDNELLPFGMHVDVFRGGHLRDAAHLIEDASTALNDVEMLIIAMGLNDRTTERPDDVVLDLQMISDWGSHYRKRLAFVEIPILPSLSTAVQETIMHINLAAKDIFGADFVEIDQEAVFVQTTDPSGLHYSVDTAKMILSRVTDHFLP
jgi:hypothetical protein